MQHSTSRMAIRFGAKAFPAMLTLFASRSEANRADLDLAFGVDGVVRLAVVNGGFNDLVVQPDGKIVAVATSETAGWAIARYNSDGSLDVTFGNGGVRTVNTQGQGMQWLLGALMALMAGFAMRSVSRSLPKLPRLTPSALPNGLIDTLLVAFTKHGRA